MKYLLLSLSFFACANLSAFPDIRPFPHSRCLNYDTGLKTIVSGPEDVFVIRQCKSKNNTYLLGYCNATGWVVQIDGFEFVDGELQVIADPVCFIRPYNDENNTVSSSDWFETTISKDTKTYTFYFVDGKKKGCVRFLACGCELIGGWQLFVD